MVGGGRWGRSPYFGSFFIGGLRHVRHSFLGIAGTIGARMRPRERCRMGCAGPLCIRLDLRTSTRFIWKVVVRMSWRGTFVSWRETLVSPRGSFLSPDGDIRVPERTIGVPEGTSWVPERGGRRPGAGEWCPGARGSRTHGSRSTQRPAGPDRPRALGLPSARGGSEVVAFMCAPKLDHEGNRARG